MRPDEARRVADQVAASRIVKDARKVDVERWGIPADSHLLRTPAAFHDEVLERFADREPKGDPMPAKKAASLLRFRPGEMTLWGGFHESYKTTFTSELMTAWACAGIQVAGASLEVPAPSLVWKMCVQALADDAPPVDRIEMALERLSETLTLYDITGRVPLKNMLAVMHYCARELKVQHFFLDNLTALLSVDNEAAGLHQAFVQDALTICTTTGMHVHLIGHARKPENGDESKIPNAYAMRGTGAAVDLAHNIVMCWRNKPKEDRKDAGEPRDDDERSGDFFLKVAKQRNWDFRGLLQFWVDRRCFRFMQYGNEPAQAFL